MAISNDFAELLPPVVNLGLEDAADESNAAFGAEHDGSDGTHDAITCLSLAAKAADGILPVTGALQFLGGAWLFDDTAGTRGSVIRPIALNATTHNYHPPGIEDAIVLEVTSDADRQLTGIVTDTHQERLLIVFNLGEFVITLKHDTGSTFHYRFTLPNTADALVGPAEGGVLLYSTADNNWHLLGVL